jgi:hypothetical protein
MKGNLINFFLIFTLVNLSFSSTLLSTNLISEVQIGKSYSLWSSNEHSWNVTWDVGYRANSLGIDSQGNILLIISNFFEYFIVKLNGSGVELWNESFSSAFCYLDSWMAYDISIDSLDNIYTVGYWEDYMHIIRYHLLLIKYDSFGNEEWYQRWNSGEDTKGVGVAIDSMDNIYVVGENFSYTGIQSDIFLVKYDCNGNNIWNCSWGGKNNELVSEIAVDSSDNVYILGATESFGMGENDLFLLKYNSSGELQWWRIWGRNLSDYGEDIIVDSSDSIYICASSEISDYPNYEMESILLKYDTSGNLLLNKTLKRFGYFSLANDELDQIYISGYDEIFHGDGTDMCLTKFNGSETMEWESFWGTIGTDRCYDIKLDSTNNIYLAGSSNGKAILLKNPENKTEGYYIPEEQNGRFITFGFYFSLFTIMGFLYVISARILKKEIN